MSSNKTVMTTMASGKPLPISEEDITSLGGAMTDQEYAEKHLKGLSVAELLDRLPTYAQIISHKWPDGTPNEVLQAWVFGVMQASEEIKDIISRWRQINA